MQTEGPTISKKFCDLKHAKKIVKRLIKICHSEIGPIFFMIQQDFQHLQLLASMQFSKVNIGGAVSDYVWASSGDFINPPVYKLICCEFFIESFLAKQRTYLPSAHRSHLKSIHEDDLVGGRFARKVEKTYVVIKLSSTVISFWQQMHFESRGNIVRNCL